MKHLFLLVDPVFDFLDAKEGVFQQCYKEDASPLISLVPIWKQVLEILSTQYKDKVTLAIVGSLYTVSQFRTKGLEQLCTTDKGRAFESSLEPYFPIQILKNNNSAIDSFVSLRNIETNSVLSNKSDFLAWLQEFENIWVAGITTCSCINKTISSLLSKQFQDHSFSIFISEDTIGCRSSQQKNAEECIQQWKSIKQCHVFSNYKTLLSDFIA